MKARSFAPDPARFVAVFGMALAGCGAPQEAATPAHPTPKAGTTGLQTSAATPYAGHGAGSVPPEVLAKFAPTPLPSDVSRRIQALLDVRAPVGSRLSQGQ